MENLMWGIVIRLSMTNSEIKSAYFWLLDDEDKQIPTRREKLLSLGSAAIPFWKRWETNLNPAIQNLCGEDMILKLIRVAAATVETMVCGHWTWLLTGVWIIASILILM